jgi:cyanophycinase
VDFTPVCARGKLPASIALLTSLLTLAIAAPAQSTYDRRPTVGPERGWLVIGGGGTLTDEVRDRFLALAGGQGARIVAIPTALTDQDIDADRYAAFIAKTLGVSRVTVLHTRDRVLADSAAFVEPLTQATGVWIEGGRQWRLADTYLGTAVEREIKNLLERGGVVCGGSAGATIQGSFLVRGAPGTADNPEGDNSVMVSPGHETGFALLADSAIDQHVIARNREADLDPVIAAHPRLLGIGLDEGAAIVVRGNSFFVVSGKVLIHDGRQHGDAHYYILFPGQAYDLRSRAVDQTEATIDRDQYPLTLTLHRAQRLAGHSGITTIGTGVLESGGTAPTAAREVSFACGASLYSIGAAAHAARLDGVHDLTIRARDVGGDAMRSFPCRIDDVQQPSSGANLRFTN